VGKILAALAKGLWDLLKFGLGAILGWLFAPIVLGLLALKLLTLPLWILPALLTLPLWILPFLALLPFLAGKVIAALLKGLLDLLKLLAGMLVGALLSPLVIGWNLLKLLTLPLWILPALLT
ncbi:hypothetical protein, partial [Secundilactobacillus kimchicus]|uniref:hypothetical protein n=1 Tax=Secundilactobacillus kimchicus TaxID=528209 RepID=UPI000A7B1721